MWSIVENLGGRITAASSSPRTLEIFSGSPKEFDLVATDMTMPRLRGNQLAAERHKLRPDIPILLLSGYNNRVTPESAASLGISTFAYNPIVKEDLAWFVRELIPQGPGISWTMTSGLSPRPAPGTRCSPSGSAHRPAPAAATTP